MFSKVCWKFVTTAAEMRTRAEFMYINYSSKVRFFKMFWKLNICNIGFTV